MFNLNTFIFVNYIFYFIIFLRGSCVALLLCLADQFPSLQSKMRVVLRVEVEAVKFLKEEPHRLDALLKRCKTITDTLAAMRKYDPDPTREQAINQDADCFCERVNSCRIWRLIGCANAPG